MNDLILFEESTEVGKSGYVMIPVSVLKKMQDDEKTIETQYHDKLATLKDMIVKIEAAVNNSE